MSKELPSRTTTLAEDLRDLHKGKRIVTLDPVKQPTLDIIVAKPFEEALAHKQETLDLATDIERAVALARDSYHNMRDINAAILAQLPERPAREDGRTTEELMLVLQPFTVLRDNVTNLLSRGRSNTKAPEEAPAIDRLNKAIDMWRTAIASRREALGAIKEGADGVYSEAEFALADRTSAYAGEAAKRHQKEFTDSHSLTQAHLDMSTQSIVGRIVDVEQRSVAIEKVKVLREQLMTEYKNLSIYLEQQAAHETDLRVKLGKEQAAVKKYDDECQAIAQEISELKRPKVDMLVDTHSDAESVDESGFIEGSLSLSDEPLREQITGESVAADEDEEEVRKTRLVSAAEDRLSDAQRELSAHRISVRDIEAELRSMHKHLQPLQEREAEMRQTIFEEMVVPVWLTVTPEIQASMQTFDYMREHDKAQFESLAKPLQDYIVAESNFLALAPRVIRQLKKIDPEYYTDFGVAEASGEEQPVDSADTRQFILSIGNVLLNRKERFIKNLLEGSQEYAVSISQRTYNYSQTTLRAGAAMMIDSSTAAKKNAQLRKELVRGNSDLGFDIAEAKKAIDNYIGAVEKKIGEMNSVLHAIHDATDKEYGVLGDIEEFAAQYAAAQEAVRTELANADAARIAQQELEASRRAAIEEQAGLGATRTADETPQPHTPADSLRQSAHINADATAADARAGSSAQLASTLHGRLWQKHDKLSAHSTETAQLIADLHTVRKQLFEVLEQGAALGHDTIVTAYETVEDTIHMHDGLPLAPTAREDAVHARFIATNGHLAIETGKNPGKTQSRVRAQLARVSTKFSGMLTSKK